MKQIVLKLTKIISIDDNGGYCQSHQKIGDLVVVNVKTLPLLGDVVKSGLMTETSGACGFGHIEFEGVVAFIDIE